MERSHYASVQTSESGSGELPAASETGPGMGQNQGSVSEPATIGESNLKITNERALASTRRPQCGSNGECKIAKVATATTLGCC